jgi:DNA-binding XRE family transcriptional regulator
VAWRIVFVHVVGVGPGLGRPLVDTIKGTSIPNLKELRVSSARILFVFDPWRACVLLVAGDKSGRWTAWYEEAIPLAEQRYEIYLEERGRARRGTAVSSYVRWQDIRAEHVERAGGEAVVATGKAELLAQVVGRRLAEVRRARGFTQSQIAERMGVTKGRVSQIERGRISGQDVLARYAAALGGQLHQAIYFDDGDIAAIA